MASAVSASRPAISNGADDPFGYDAAVDDFLRDIPIHNEATNRDATHNGPNDTSQNPDAEVKIKKKRRPVPKLDETLLLSNKGIPQLRRIAKKNLKFKGKGHEFTDVQRLLATYQLWLDDLYPRAKFRDAMGMVERLGHGKRMQVMRRTWIDETKPKARSPSEEREEEIVGGTGTTAPENTDRNSSAVLDGEGSAESGENGDVPFDDELDGLLGENGLLEKTHAQSAKSTKPRGPFEEDDEDLDNDDDLDALLAEHSATNANVAGQTYSQDAHDKFADEEEAMAGLDW